MTPAPVAVRRWWLVPVVAWLATRVAVLTATVITAALWGVPERGVGSEVPRQLSPLGGWDTTWYLDIARGGYDTFTPLVRYFYTNLAFFPLLPSLMAGAARVGINPFAAALLAANLGFLVALCAFHRLTARVRGEDAADLATWVVALVPPWTVYSGLAYTEGIVLGLAVAAALAAARGRWLLAGLVAAPAAVARPPGLLVAVLVALIALSVDAPRGRRLMRAVIALVPSLVALAAFFWWMQVHRGSWHLPLDAQKAWDRGPVGVGWLRPRQLWSTLGELNPLNINAAWTAAVRDVAFTVLDVWLLLRLRARDGWRSPWVLYSALTLAMPLSTGSLQSMSRFGVMAFPLAWAGGEWVARVSPGRRRALFWVCVVVSLLLVAQLEVRSP